MDRRQVYGGPHPPLSSLSVVHVHRVHVLVAGEEGFLCFPPRRVPAGGVLTGELPQRRWRPIEVGRSFARPR